jgi:NTE family protein
MPAPKTIEADGVFGAGGIRSLAIAGALAECSENETLRIERWCNVAGTSGGAIIAAFLAAGRTPAELLERLDRVPRPEFGPGGPLIGGARNLIRRHGLTQGAHLQKWLDNELDFLTFASLRSPRVNGTEPEHPYRLRIVAADITNRRVLTLPDDLPKYRLLGNDDPIDPDKFRVAHAVRMSFSIPFWVDPAHLVYVETGRPATIVDGGVLSSFPVWLFDRQQGKLQRPTLGLRLKPWHARRHLFPGPAWPLGMALDIARTPADAWDERFLSEADTVRTCMIDAGAIGSISFHASQKQREELIHRGRVAAREFLQKFKLARYQNAHGRGMS